MDTLLVRQKIIRSMIRVDDRTKNMRKPEKFQMRENLTQAYINMLEWCTRANKSRGKERVNCQKEMDVQLEIIRSLIDFAVSPDVKLISPGLHELWSKELDEIGRLLGGWMKYPSDE